MLSDGTPRFIEVPDDYVVGEPIVKSVVDSNASPEKKSPEGAVNVEEIVDADFKEIPGESPSDRFLRLKNFEIAKKEHQKSNQ